MIFSLVVCAFEISQKWNPSRMLSRMRIRKVKTHSPVARSLLPAAVIKACKLRASVPAMMLVRQMPTTVRASKWALGSVVGK